MYIPESDGASQYSQETEYKVITIVLSNRLTLQFWIFFSILWMKNENEKGTGQIAYMAESS